jgi:hypothetical protein
MFAALSSTIKRALIRNQIGETQAKEKGPRHVAVPEALL